MPRDFYEPELTDKSFTVLQRLVAKFPNAVLIGGWGTWVRKQDGPKSHDIDLIVSNDELDAIRGQPDVADFSSTDHVGGRKHRATIDGIHLDLYVPYQSRLGQRLGLRAEHLVSHAERVDTWNVLTPAAQAATKVAALLDRPETHPGAKDRHELLELFRHTNPRDVVRVIAAASEHPIANLRTPLTGELFGYLEETDGVGKKERKALRATQAGWEQAITERIGPTQPTPAELQQLLRKAPPRKNTVAPYVKEDATRVRGHPRRPPKK